MTNEPCNTHRCQQATVPLIFRSHSPERCPHADEDKRSKSGQAPENTSGGERR